MLSWQLCSNVEKWPVLPRDTSKITAINSPEMDTVISPWSLLLGKKKPNSVKRTSAVREQFKKWPVNQV